MAYTQFGPFQDGGAPGLDDSFFNAIETYLLSLKKTMEFTTPYQLLTAVTINAGVTNTYTATGGSTNVPAGARGVLIGVTITSATVGAYGQLFPANGTAGQYFTIGNIQVANQYCNLMAICPLDTNGQFKIKANTGNCVFDLWLFGYVTAG